MVQQGDGDDHGNSSDQHHRVPSRRRCAQHCCLGQAQAHRLHGPLAEGAQRDVSARGLFPRQALRAGPLCTVLHHRPLRLRAAPPRRGVLPLHHHLLRGQDDSAQVQQEAPDVRSQAQRDVPQHGAVCRMVPPRHRDLGLWLLRDPVVHYRPALDRGHRYRR